MTDRKLGSAVDIPDRTWVVWAISLSLLVAFTRVLALRSSSLDLLPDEAQYWSWSRHLAFGYFSKPPMIAWLIHATTAVFGDDEWAVRLSAPLLHAATGIAICFIGKDLYGARIGFISALIYATLPGVAFSGLVISTDAPLIWFWSVALLAFWRVWTRPSWVWSITLGVAFGLGMLSKYAMAYFLLGVAVHVALSARTERTAALRYLGVSALIAVAVVVPNLAWNAAHGWATIGHTAANANWGAGGGLHLLETAEFALAQFGIFGPLLLVALILRVALLHRDKPVGGEGFLLAFAVPVLALMLLQSGVSRAHANWAAVSYVAATILVVGWLDRRHLVWPIRLTLGLHVVAFSMLTLIFAGAIAVKLPKTADIFHQMRGWRNLGDMVWRRMGTMPDGTNVAADDREVMAELDYYLRGRPFALAMATGKGPPGNQYELENAVTVETGAHLLLISRFLDRHDILDRYSQHALTETWTIGAGQGRQRRYYVYDASGFKEN